MSDSFEVRGFENDEVRYYVSLGYSKVTAEQIASFDFKPRDIDFDDTGDADKTAALTVPYRDGYLHDYTYYRTDDSDVEYSPATGVDSADPVTEVASGEYIFWGDRKQNTQQDFLTTCREQNVNYLPFHLTYSEMSPEFRVSCEYKREGDRGYLLLGINESDICREFSDQNLVLLLDTANLNYRAPFVRSTLATLFAALDGRMSVVAFDRGRPVVFRNINNSDEAKLIKLFGRLGRLENSDSYAISDGLREAYSVAKEIAREAHSSLSRVILITGAGKCRLLENTDLCSSFIRGNLAEGTGFSCVAAYPYTDGYASEKIDGLSELVKAGEGALFLANTPSDVARVLDRRYDDFLYGRRRFAKAMIDFNPNMVSAYRLIGAYEHRGLCALNDAEKKKSVEPEADVGNYVMACYELSLTDEGMTDFVPKGEDDYDCDHIAEVRIRLEGKGMLYRSFTRQSSSIEHLDRMLEVEREAERLKKEYEDKLRGCAAELAGAMKRLDAGDYGC